MYVTSATFKGRTLLYQPTPLLIEVVEKKYRGRLSKNRRIRKKQVKRFAGDIIMQALELFGSEYIKNKTEE